VAGKIIHLSVEQARAIYESGPESLFADEICSIPEKKTINFLVPIFDKPQVKNEPTDI